LTSAQDNVDIYGRPLPDDAAPYEMQVWRELCDPTATHTTFSAVVSVYQRICGSDMFSDWLTELDENLNLIPAAAESWEVSEDGLTWYFHLRPGQVWSDGTPLTANDWVASFRFMADRPTPTTSSGCGRASSRTERGRRGRSPSRGNRHGSGRRSDPGGHVGRLPAPYLPDPALLAAHAGQGPPRNRP
jgi:ABC-type transport system substrate-binding protein